MKLASPQDTRPLDLARACKPPRNGLAPSGLGKRTSEPGSYEAGAAGNSRASAFVYSLQVRSLTRA